MSRPGDSITRVANQLAAGSLASDADPHVRRVYDELRSLASSHLSREGQPPFHTTDLVHQAYVKLFRAPEPPSTPPNTPSSARPPDAPPPGPWQSRAHFFGSAARAMEHLLIDAARQRRAGIGLNGRVVTHSSAGVRPQDLAAAIDAMAMQDMELAQIARLKLFAGLTIPLLAETLGLSQRTVQRRWTFARTWLAQRLGAGPEDGPDAPDRP